MHVTGTLLLMTWSLTCVAQAVHEQWMQGIHCLYGADPESGSKPERLMCSMMPENNWMCCAGHEAGPGLWLNFQRTCDHSRGTCTCPLGQLL